MLYTLFDVAVFCYENKGKAFKGGDFKAVASEVVCAAKENKLYLVHDAGGKLIGACIATIRYVSKTIYVHQIVCKDSAFRTFIAQAREKYPEFSVAGKRKNKQVKTFKLRHLWVTSRKAK